MQEQHTLPAPASNSKGSCQQEAPQGGCLTSPAAHSADRLGSADFPAPAIPTTNTGLNVDTSRVLFPSPQGSVGNSAQYVSPTGGALRDDVPQHPAAGSEHHTEKPSEPSAPPNARTLSHSEQQLLLSQDDIDEGALSSNCWKSAFDMYCFFRCRVTWPISLAVPVV